MTRTLHALLWAALAAAMLVAGAVGGWATAPLRATAPVSTAEARAAFADIQRAVLTPDGPLGAQALCARWSDDQTLCRASWESVADRSPVVEASITRTRLLEDGSALVEVAGVDRSGESFRSTIQLVRVDGEIRAVDPVYWLPRTVVVADPPH